MTGPDLDPGDVQQPRVVLGAGAFLYMLMTALALGWLWLRDRIEVLPAQAIGQHGPWLAAGLGLAIGWCGAMVFAVLARRVQKFRAYAALTRRVFNDVGEVAAIAFVLLGAVAEELLFRLAVQDAIGVFGSVAVYVLLHMGIGGAWVIPVSLLHGLALGLLVHQGFGLLSSTTANAIMNYLSLRRIQCT
ncbi:MAG TPA: hypothetical protein VFD82_21485 [Planctomycetota bacterium]|nr:hypothetical protein [Planctomycetota bacterium]